MLPQQLDQRRGEQESSHLLLALIERDVLAGISPLRNLIAGIGFNFGSLAGLFPWPKIRYLYKLCDPSGSLSAQKRPVF